MHLNAHQFDLRPSRWHIRVLCVLGCLGVWGLPAYAQDVSAPATLQMFEARWDTIEDRMVDIFRAGYGAMWLPPPGRADSGNQSVGYDVYDRFDLGRPRNQTLYGTETSLKKLVHDAHLAGVGIYTDMILNHNGFSDSSTNDDRGTPGNPADDVSFVQAGDYPGFVVTLSAQDDPQGIGDIDGDFHGAFQCCGQIYERLSGLIDIAQEKNHQFIRHPVDPQDPRNIPTGAEGVFGRPPADVPDPNNARFYPDQDLGGTTVFDPRLGQNVTLYDFNTTDSLAGDPVLENAMALLMRHVRWMVQEVGVDGFRLDAARHFERWVLDFFDQATFLAKKEPLLDGSPQHVFSFSETGFDSPAFIQDFIRKDIDNGNLGQVGGNRDVLDFNLFGALRDNLTGNGFANNWHAIRNASQDVHDDGLRNGSQGVSFVQSHDDIGPFLMNVAYAYTLMRPGNAIVYLNAMEFGDGRDFPRDGKADALGGFFGDAITTLVNLRNTHGRGNFHERWIDNAFEPDGFSNIYIYERGNAAIVGLNSRLDAGYDERTPVATEFAPGTVLVELTGNAADPAVDPGGDIPEAIRVDAGGNVTLRVPRNDGHDRGYVVYGLATPQGTLSISNVSATLSGATPTETNFGTARRGDVLVIHSDTFDIELNTTPVTLPAPFGEVDPVRDVDADGDQAQFRFDGGLDLNANPGVDTVTPGSVSYGFEEFTDTRVPGYIDDGNGNNIGTGSGTYIQTIDATGLAEGRHFITVRAFRHRDDGGPAVYRDFREVIYLDRLPPEAEIVSFEPFSSSPQNLEDRDLIVRSVDQTADNMHFFLDLPAGLSDAEVLQMALGGQNDAGEYDRDKWIFGFFDVGTGNHAATVVTFEPTFNGTSGYNVQRFGGLFTETGHGAGFGDADFDGMLEPNDIRGMNNNSVQDVLYSQNAKFNAAVDANGDGLVDNRDLFALGGELASRGADGVVLRAYHELLIQRGDLNDSGGADPGDFDALYDGFGSATWLLDLDVDETTSIADVHTLIADVLRTVPGDFDLNGLVNDDDLAIWTTHNGTPTNARYTQGDADLDGDVDGDDLALLDANRGFVGALAIAAADFNVDGHVGAADYPLWRNTLGSTTDLAADADRDGEVGLADFDFWRTLYGRSLFDVTPPAAAALAGAAVPEPGSLWMIAVALLAITCWRGAQISRERARSSSHIQPRSRTRINANAADRRGSELGPPHGAVGQVHRPRCSYAPIRSANIRSIGVHPRPTLPTANVACGAGAGRTENLLLCFTSFVDSRLSARIARRT